MLTKISSLKLNNLNEKVNTARVNNVTTARPKAVVSAAEGNGENAVKSSTCWIWRPKRNVIDHTSKDSGSYMFKRFNYVDLQGILKSVMAWIIKKLMVDLLHLVEVLKEVKLLEKKNSVLFTETECIVLSLDFKLLDESQVLLKVPRQKNMYSFDLKNVVHSRGIAFKVFENAIIVLLVRRESKHKALSYDQLPVTVGNQTNKNAGIKDNVDAVPIQKYILLPLLFDSPNASRMLLLTDDAGKKTNEEPANKGERNGQEKEGGASNKEDDQNVQDFRAELDNLLVQQKEGYANSTNRDNTVSPSVSTAGQIFTNAGDLPTDPLMPDLEDTVHEALTKQTWKPHDVSPISITRIHKDHSKDQIIRDINSATQTRRMTKISKEHAMMDVKSAFLYGTIEDEVYVSQHPGFMDPEFIEKVYKVEKALYGLHQAPRALYETLSTYLLDNGFYRGQIDKTLFIKRVKGDILLVQVYVDDIIFGSTKKSLCTDFEQIIHKMFQMILIGELTFFLGLQVKQKEDGIFISQDKYVGEILKKFGFSSVRTANTPMETNKALTKDEDGEDVDIHLYRLMIGSLMYLTSSRPDIMFSVCACSRF
ncbi:putative ribonuclease H-like domain-containing protein [Tanacetum coccineum]